MCEIFLKNISPCAYAFLPKCSGVKLHANQSEDGKDEESKDHDVTQPSHCLQQGADDSLQSCTGAKGYRKSFELCMFVNGRNLDVILSVTVRVCVWVGGLLITEKGRVLAGRG